MTKADIVNWILRNKKTKLNRKEVQEVVNKIFDKIINELENAEHNTKVQISGFGTFLVKRRASKIGRNPKTKEEKLIPERLGISFKPGKHLKEALKKK